MLLALVNPRMLGKKMADERVLCRAGATSLWCHEKGFAQACCLIFSDLESKLVSSCLCWHEVLRGLAVLTSENFRCQPDISRCLKQTADGAALAMST